MMKWFWVVLISMSIAACGTLETEVIVRTDEIGILVNTRDSASAQVLPPGRYELEFSQRVYFYPTFTQIYKFSGESDAASGNTLATGAPLLQATTLDDVAIQVGLDVVFKINPDAVLQIHQQWAATDGDYRAGYVYNTVRIVTRSVISNYTSAQLYGIVREDLQRAIAIPLRAEFAENGFILDRISLLALQLPQEIIAQLEANLQATLTPAGN